MGARSHGSQVLNADGRMWFPGVSLRLVLLRICATQRSKLNGSKPRSKRWLSGLNGDRSRLGNLRGERSSTLGLPLASVPLAGYSTTAELRSNALKIAMSASLIGRLGSSTFRLSAAAVSMSLTGSCFSSESALGPFHHGIRGRGGTIFWSALPSDERQVQADMRTHLIHRPARDIIPPLGGARLSSYRV